MKRTQKFEVKQLKYLTAAITKEIRERYQGKKLPSARKQLGRL